MNSINEPPKFVGKLQKWHYMTASIIFDVLFLAFSIEFAQLLGSYTYLIVPVVLIPIFHWKNMVKAAIDNNSSVRYVVATLLSGVITFFLHNCYISDRVITSHAISFFIINVITITILLLMVLTYKLLDVSSLRKNIVRSAVAVGGLVFTVLIYLPTDSYMANYTEYNFAYLHLIWWSAIRFIVAAVFATLFIAALKEKYFNVIYCGALGLFAAVYVQYMFMNSRLDLLGMSEFNWEKHIGYAVFNAVVWLMLLAAPFAAKKLLKEEMWDKVSMGITSVLTALHVVSYAILLVLAPERAYVYTETNYEFIADEQFTISSNKNTIIVVADAFDNRQLERAIEEHPEWLYCFNDFTVYTNTCSVFRNTEVSMTQMFSGMEYEPSLSSDEWYSCAWNGERATEFYKRLHDDNYVVNAYNFESNAYEAMSKSYNNMRKVTSEEKIPLIVDTEDMQRCSAKLILYRTLPFALKPLVDVTDIDFSSIAVYNVDSYMPYTNSEFNSALSAGLSVADDKNYFIVQHISGMHYPLQDEDVAMQQCFEAVRIYIDKLKEIGAYDEATILLVADHGVHGSEFAPTPVFMIKEPYASHESYVYNNAPIYHTDILSTLLINAGLMERDSEEDKALFGPSIYDFDESSVRERVLVDRRSNEYYPKGAYFEYRYTDGYEELNRSYISSEYDNVFPILY